MLTRIRNYGLVVIAIGIFYFLLHYHVLFYSFTEFDLLEKTEPTFKFTFISVRQVNPYTVLRNESLRDAGLGEYLVEKGRLSETRLQQVLQRIDAQREQDAQE